MSGRQDRLERRYRRLLAAYPTAYREERGNEIVATYLDAADSDRRWPSVADVADVLRGGVWQRLRSSGAVGLAASVPVAATFALTAAAALSAVWLVSVELGPAQPGLVMAPVGPFLSLGGTVWIAWLGVALAALGLPALVARRFLAAALTATVAVVPVAALSGYSRPPLLVLVPQVALGLLALGWPTRPAWTVRLTPAFGTLAAVAVTVWIGDGGQAEYRWNDSMVLTYGAIVLLVGSILTGFIQAVRGDSRGLWAVLLLLLPAGLLSVETLAALAAGAVGRGTITDGSYLAGVTVAVSLLAVTAPLLAVTLRRRQIRRLPQRCPTCGRMRT
jgi:hypothetical protein